MPIIVTLDMYSGRPNPSWEISEADATTLKQLLAKKRSISNTSSPGSSGLLGYRGLLVSSINDSTALKTMRAFDGILEVASLDSPNHLDHDSEIEGFLLGTAGMALGDDER